MWLPVSWSVNKWLLLFGNVFFGSLLITLTFTNVFPLDPVNFLFFSFIGLLFALYRPGWAFLLLIGMLPYEHITIAPDGWPLDLRPYQWLLVLILMALLIRVALKRFPLEKFVLNFWDKLLIVFGVSAGVSALMSTDQMVALKISVIIFSFLLLYFCCRLFVRSVDDARMLVPFILSSFMVVACFAIVQNILFLSGWESLEVMSGRPNATFAEADWLGGYLAVIIVGMCAFIAFPFATIERVALKRLRFLFSFFLFVGYVALLVSVSRSAWLAAFVGILFIVLYFGWQKNVWRSIREWDSFGLRDSVSVKLYIVAPGLLALFVVSFFHFTSFDLWDRGKSVTSGEQKITIACERLVTLPEKIVSTEALADFGCVHIRLEEKEVKQNVGAYVTEVFRDDPNVHLRQDIYKKSMAFGREHWFAGIGFGVIGQYLGTDERGVGLNTSNLFLEIWLGSGLMGIAAFGMLWFGLGYRWLSLGIRQQNAGALIVGSVWIATTVFNLFNAGLLLGWFFVFLALLSVVLPVNKTQTYE